MQISHLEGRSQLGRGLMMGSVYLRRPAGTACMVAGRRYIKNSVMGLRRRYSMNPWPVSVGRGFRCRQLANVLVTLASCMLEGGRAPG